MAMREQLARDLGDSRSLQWRPESQGSIDRVTAHAFNCAEGYREQDMLSLGSVLWGYKLLWTAPRGGLSDEFLATRRERAERDRHEAYLILACLLRDRKQLKAFKGPAEQGKMLAEKTGWYHLAIAAIDEWVNDLCRACHGAKVIKDPETQAVILTCPTCHGSGKHRYTDAERQSWLARWSACFPDVADFEGLKVGMPQWNEAMTLAHDLVGTADRAKAAAMARVLERY